MPCTSAHSLDTPSTQKPKDMQEEVVEKGLFRGKRGKAGKRGPRGHRGPQEIQGIQGEQGPAGADGAQGPAFSTTYAFAIGTMPIGK